MFNTAKPLSIVSERSEKINDECGKSIDAGKLLISYYFRGIV
jgi:hypothetical protein